MHFASLWDRFRRRKIATWTAAYVTAAAALFGTLETIGNVFDWPAGPLRAVFFILVAGLLATLVVAWFHGERGRQGVGALELGLLAIAAVIGASGAAWSLRSTPAAESAAATEPPPPASSRETEAARAAYVAGEADLRQRTPASVIQAIGKYREAATLDPRMAAAHAREAYAYGLFVDWGWTYPGIETTDLLGRGLALSKRALAIDSLSPEAWLARAYLLQLSDPDHPGAALAAYSRAVDLDPTNPEAHHQYGQTMMMLGRYAEARSAYHAALAIEPRRPLTLVALSAIARWTRDSAGTRRWADSSVAVGEDAPYAWASRGLNTLDTRDPTDVAADAEHALRIDPSYEVPARAVLAAALWRQGDRDRALQELARSRSALADPDEPSPTDALYLGAALVSMGRIDEALELVEATRPRSRWLWFYLQSPAFDAVREDERFRRVVEAAAGERT